MNLQTETAMRIYAQFLSTATGLSNATEDERRKLFSMIAKFAIEAANCFEEELSNNEERKG